MSTENVETPAVDSVGDIATTTKTEIIDNEASLCVEVVNGKDCDANHEDAAPPYKSSEYKVVYNWTDITGEFVDACSQLELGELLHDTNFGLFEGMSAIEMMDPKMDAGMLCNQTKHKVLTVEKSIETGRLRVDGLTNPELIGVIDETFACLVTWLEGHSLAQTVFINLYLHDTSVIKDRTLKAFCVCFLKLVDNIRDRINRASVFEEEDFQSLTYGFKMAGDEAETAVMATVRELEDELARIIKSTRQKVGSERDTATELEHELCVALNARLKFVRLFLLVLVSFSKEQKWAGVEEGLKYLNQMKELVDVMKKSVDLGIKPPTAQDGDTGHESIMGFEPYINQRLLPPTFPRYTRIKTRVETMDYFVSLIARLGQFSAVIQLNDNLHSVLEFFVEFSRSSPCMLSRSLLQLLYIPAGSRHFGSRSMTDALKDALRSFCAPPALMPKGALYNNPAAKECVEVFLAHAVRPIVLMFQITGHNRARQRDKWARLLEEFAALQDEAERADGCIHTLMLKVDPSWLYHACFSTWTLYHTLHVMIRHTLAGLELELYLPHEYQYVFWYLCEGMYNWLMTTLSRADHFVVEYDMLKDKANKAAKKNKRKKKTPSVHHSELTLVQALQCLCAGYYKAMIGLTMDGKIQLPKYDFDCEEYRYNHRFAQFACLNTPPPLPYGQFRDSTDISRYEPALESSNLYSASAKSFQQSRTQLENIATPSDEVQTLLKIAKTNFVVVSVLCKGHKRDAKVPIQFDFTQHKLFPVFKLP